MSNTPAIRIYWYSQTGQLREAAATLSAPLQRAGWRVEWVEVKPAVEFPFPWPLGRFFGIFADAVDPAASVELTQPPSASPAADGDFALFAFQVWYLSPSLPMRSLLRSVPGAFEGRDVIGLVACRNMWYSAAIEVQQMLADAGARYLGTIAATDTASPLATFVTTLRWLLTGRREAFWRFPRAGVGEDELARLRALGEQLATVGAGPDVGDRVRDILAGQNAARVEPALAAADLIASRAFRRWGRVIRASPGRVRRTALIGMFVGGLIGAILTGLPAMAVTRALNKARFDASVRRRLASVLAESVGPRERLR